MYLLKYISVGLLKVKKCYILFFLQKSGEDKKFSLKVGRSFFLSSLNEQKSKKNKSRIAEKVKRKKK